MNGSTADAERQRRLYLCIARTRDLLAAVRPALDRLSSSLHRDVYPIELAVADVERRLVHARRGVRELEAEVRSLDSEARDLLARVRRYAK